MNKLLIFFFVISWELAACSTARNTFDQEAVELGFKAQQVQGRGFQQLVYENNPSRKSEVLNVYLGSDGTPWFDGRYVTRDPTPLRPVMLRLMRLDPEPAIYLGRPCYHQQQMPTNCTSDYWTSGRYSPVVIDSMVTALRNYLKNYSYKKVRLFGFSGGGTLVMLMAPRVSEVTAVVTLAGNLDTDAWTTHHGYLPLSNSLNPARQKPLPEKIRQIHLSGLKDQNIPSFMVERFAARQVNVQFVRLKSADHHCCWKEEWLSVLKVL